MKSSRGPIQTHREMRVKDRSTASITVVCRKRPLIASEVRRGEQDVMRLSTHELGRIKVAKQERDLTGQPFISNQVYEFDRVYGASHTTEHVYDDCIAPMVGHFLESGGKSSVFTYGQTGSGKTYSMLGCPRRQREMESGRIESLMEEFEPHSHSPSSGSKDEFGLLQMAVSEIFHAVRDSEVRTWARVSCYEIYINKVFDLFNDRKQLRSLEGANGDVSVHGLQFEYCSSMPQVLECITAALKTRITGANQRNKTSSRGHFICQLELVSSVPPETPSLDSVPTVAAARRKRQVPASMQGSGGAGAAAHPPALRGGKLAFIDLAGSERGADAANSSELRGGTNGDGANINKSLLALKECIRAIDSGSNHVPFRDSILTKVLREFLVPADSRTLMMVHVTPAESTVEPAMNSLHYASMVRQLRRRCKALLACKPPAASPDEVYLDPPAPVPKRMSELPSTDRGGGKTREPRRFSALPARRLSAPAFDATPFNEARPPSSADRLEDLLPTPPRPDEELVIEPQASVPDTPSLKAPQVRPGYWKFAPPGSNESTLTKGSSQTEFEESAQQYPELNALKHEIQEATQRIKNASDVTLIDQKHRLTIVIGELMFSEYNTLDVDELKYRSHLARIATSVEGEIYLIIRRRLEQLEGQIHVLEAAALSAMETIPDEL